jgi:hypothetical protein
MKPDSPKIVARKAQFVAECRKLMDKHGLQDWIVEIANYAEQNKGPGGYAAFCSYSEKLIKLGYVELLMAGSKRARRNIYLHEIAHALVFIKHGSPIVRGVRRTKHLAVNGWYLTRPEGTRVPVIDVKRQLIPPHGKIWRDIAYSIGVRDSSGHNYGLAGRHKKAKSIVARREKHADDT